jgi:hypothetical protein
VELSNTSKFIGAALVLGKTRTSEAGEVGDGGMYPGLLNMLKVCKRMSR